MDRQLSRALAPSLMYAAAVTLAAGPTAAETRPQYGGAVQAALASAPTSLDPLRGGPGDTEVAALVFDTPFTVDGVGHVRPSLALTLDNPDGATRARLTLRPDLHFSDGTPLTARDVAASLARAMRDPGGWSLAPIRAVRAVGDDGVELELGRPTPELSLLLTTPAAMVTPGGAVPVRGKAIGSGPFIVESADAQTIRLAANAICPAGRPYLSTLTLRAFASRGDEAGSFEVGALHAMRHSAPVEDTGTRHPSVVVDGPQTITGFIAVGRITDAEVVRRVVALAINRERLRRLTVREPATVAAAAVPPALGGPSSKPVYDPTRARAEVERRWPGTRPHLGLLVDDSRLDDRDVAERILADLARVGVDVTIDAVEAAQYRARLDASRYDLVLGSAAAPAPDAALAGLALVAVVDPMAARLALAHAGGATVDIETTRIVPLFHRATRLQVAPALRDVRLDLAGHANWADVHWLAR
jgi:peptide/nickel transport system substrate-binding protein